ncbi:MAG TPA: hypothetical protein DEA96_11350 [Leptospiraceae bacterium]|nr:hypothetical protein [Spirochaetaceae bacterium]HBS05555.1 hypothetical protein [Leptospiraceae bacterium]|tara:strand:- start:18862 stop:19686 length:825 start_codon:yes stop_codon:yes gene_type:complete
MIAAESRAMAGSPVAEILRSNSWAIWTGILHAVLFVSLLVLSLIDHRTVDGVDNWYKPMKFALSISIFAFTLPFLTRPLMSLKGVPGWRSPLVLSRIICLMLWGEMILITFQAARGVRSHFNIESALGGAIYSAMGLMILISTIATALLVLPYFRRAAELDPGPSIIQGIRFGSALFLMGSLAGGIMSSMLTHSVGDPGMHRIPFLGWSTTAGDIRAVHFFGLHAIQILPLIGWLGQDRSWSPGWISGFNWFYSAVFLGITVLTGAGLSVVYWM